MGVERMSAVLPSASAWGGLRVKATGIHLLISLAVAAVAAALVFWVWYPRGYASLMRGGELFFILIAVDVILGPALSFVICNPAKPRRTLVLDYAVIGAVQLAALVYGLSVVAQSRPAFEVFSVDRFNIVSAFEIENDGSANVQRFVPGWFGPKPINLVMPTDGPARNKALDLELSGKQLHLMPGYYGEYQPELALAKAQVLPVLLARFPKSADAVNEAVRLSGRGAEQLRWVPAATRFGFLTALVTSDTAQIVALVALDPF
jgi:hypothetical protein